MHSILILTSILLGVARPTVASNCRPGHASFSSIAPSVSSSSSTPPIPSYSAAAGCYYSYIVNPDFAHGLNGWTNTNAVGTYTTAPSTDCGTGYDTCLDLTAVSPPDTSNAQASTAAVSQDTIAVTPGRTYTVSYRFRVTSVSAGAYYGVYLDGVPWSHLLVGTSLNQWTTATQMFTASGSSVSVSPFFSSIANTFTAQITDVRLETCF